MAGHECSDRDEDNTDIDIDVDELLVLPFPSLSDSPPAPFLVSGRPPMKEYPGDTRAEVNAHVSPVVLPEMLSPVPFVKSRRASVTERTEIAVPVSPLVLPSPISDGAMSTWGSVTDWTTAAAEEGVGDTAVSGSSFDMCLSPARAASVTSGRSSGSGLNILTSADPAHVQLSIDRHDTVLGSMGASATKTEADLRTLTRTVNRLERSLHLAKVNLLSMEDHERFTQFLDHQLGVIRDAVDDVSASDRRLWYRVSKVEEYSQMAVDLFHSLSPAVGRIDGDVMKMTGDLVKHHGLIEAQKKTLRTMGEKLGKIPTELNRIDGVVSMRAEELRDLRTDLVRTNVAIAKLQLANGGQDCCNIDMRAKHAQLIWKVDAAEAQISSLEEQVALIEKVQDDELIERPRLAELVSMTVESALEHHVVKPKLHVAWKDDHLALERRLTELEAAAMAKAAECSTQPDSVVPRDEVVALQDKVAKLEAALQKKADKAPSRASTPAKATSNPQIEPSPILDVVLVAVIGLSLLFACIEWLGWVFGIEL